MTPSQERLKLAFAYDVVRRIVGADAREELAETAFVQQSFPWALLLAHGFVTPDGRFTEAFDEAVAEAIVHLPSALAREEKLALVTTFLDAAIVDDQLEHAEGQVLLEAATSLGLTAQDVMAHLDTLRSVGEVDLDEPEPDDAG